MNEPRYDLAVVGAGIVGAACAFEASRAGLRVVVLERGRPAEGATGAAMGHLVALDGSDAELALCRLSQKLWRELGPSLPPSVHYRETGTIWLASDEKDLLEARRKQARLAVQEVPSTLLDREQLARAEPALRAGLAGGLFVPGDAVLDPVEATKFFLSETQRLGGWLALGVAATGIADGTVSRGNDDPVRAKTVLNAAGVDSARMSEGVPVRPRKGHLLRFDEVPAPLEHQLVELGYSASVRSAEATSVAFNAHPGFDGSWTVGASREWGSADSAVNHSTVDRIQRRAAEFLPALGGATVAKTWAGLRPAMPDHLPWIGPLPETERVWVATGHEGLGVTCAIGTARLLVDALRGRRPEIPLEPYLPRPERRPWPRPHSSPRGAA